MSDTSSTPDGRDVVLVAHPSAECYGSDLQMVETVRACLERGAQVVVTLPGDGPLVPVLRAAGARVLLMDVPVLRRSMLSSRGLLGLAVGAATALRGQLRMIRRTGAGCVLVNTLTIPTWLAAARLAGVRAVCHVHEAEDTGPWAVRAALAAPLLAAHAVVANSAASRAAVVGVVPALAARTRVVHNGVGEPGRPTGALRDRVPGDPATVVLVGRLSLVKGTDVALEAVAALRDEGRPVRLLLAGAVFAGYEWFERRLRDRAARADLDGAVDFLGYVDPWPCYEAADVVIVPSRIESFGNVAVEAMLAGRPVVASRTQGLVEVVRDGVDGTLVEPEEPAALARAVAAVLDDPRWARARAERAAGQARERFSVPAYHSAIWAAVMPARAEDDVDFAR
ncbi:glycosyltransferase family 4 protein [Isoptericola hypogeus]|uniref:Glycosyltransferase family 4 protein n=1 Tax=Isoptericola hypogeus TaxID=300179 RepID=A0ABP4VQM1_9MICO